MVKRLISMTHLEGHTQNTLHDTQTRTPEVHDCSDMQYNGIACNDSSSRKVYWLEQGVMFAMAEKPLGAINRSDTLLNTRRRTKMTPSPRTNNMSIFRFATYECTRDKDCATPAG